MTAATRETSARGLLLTLVALLVLAAISFGFRFTHLGNWGYAVGLGIAVVKAVLVAFFFMEIATEKPSVGLAFVTGLLLLAVMVAFILGDIATRAVPPLSNPPDTSPRDLG